MQVEILLKKIRKERGITLATLSKKTGLSTTHINDIENNLKVPGLIVVILLSKALNVDIHDIYKIKY